MNYGIGVRTPRGTGTSGWVQQSKAYIKQSVIDQHKRSTRNKTEVYDEDERKPKLKVVSTAVLEHERKMKIENEVVDWAIEQGFYDPDCDIPKEDITKLTNEKRKEIAKKYERTGSGTAEELQDGTHEMAREKEEENTMMKRVFRVDDTYRDGDAFNKEYQERKRIERIQSKYQAEKEKRLKEIEEEERERMRKEEELKKAQKEKREAERRQRKLDKERRKQRKMLKKIGLSSKDIETVFSSSDPDAAFTEIMSAASNVKKEKEKEKEEEEEVVKKSEGKNKHHHKHHHDDVKKEDEEKSDASTVKKEKTSDSDDETTKHKRKDEHRHKSKHRHRHRSPSTDSGGDSGSESYSSRSNSDDSREERRRKDRNKKGSYKRSRSASSGSEESDYDRPPKKNKRSH